MRDERSLRIVNKICENHIYFLNRIFEDLPASSSLSDEKAKRGDAGGNKHTCHISLCL